MYPVFLDISDRLCVVIGGGRVAVRKVISLLEEGARVRVVSPEVEPEIAGLAGEGRVEWMRKKFEDSDLAGALLVFAATDDRSVQDRIRQRAREDGLPVNVADDPENCTFQVPAVSRRGDLAIAVSTGGGSPALAAMIRQELDNRYGPEYEELLDIMARVRERLSGSATQAERKKIYKKILHADIVEWIRTGRRDRVRAHLAEVLGADFRLDFRGTQKMINS